MYKISYWGSLRNFNNRSAIVFAETLFSRERPLPSATIMRDGSIPKSKRTCANVTAIPSSLNALPARFDASFARRSAKTLSLHNIMYSNISETGRESEETISAPAFSRATELVTRLNIGV